MPICSKSPTEVGNTKSTAEIDDYASEAAKMKRTREQAYFNSYNFDAIEVLPYNDDDNDDATKRISEQCSKHSHPGTQNTLTKYRNTSLSSKSGRSSSSSACSDSSRRSSAQSNDSGGDKFMRHGRTSDMNYGFLQRFGAALSIHSRQSSPTQPAPTCSIIGCDDATLNAALTINATHADPDNGNFLLPRAMLKYQSVGNANSMPLAVISATTASTTTTTTPTATAAVHSTGRVDKLLQNGHNHNHSRSHSHNYHSHGDNTESSNKTIMMSTNASNNHKRNANNSTTASNANTNTNRNSNHNSSSRHNYANSNDGCASLLIGADQDATLRVASATAATTTTTSATAAPAAAATATKSSAPTRIKKQSTSSTITTTASSSSVDHELLPSQAVSARGDRSSRNTTDSKSGNNSAASERRGRTSSHQSHYSTDKSGSSGYYSSNVCSTYSLEDHIYCEPVIDILDASAKSKSATIPQLLDNTVNAAAVEGARLSPDSRSRDMNGVAQVKRFGGRHVATDIKSSDDGDDACEDDDRKGDRTYHVDGAHVRKSKIPSIPGMAARVGAPGIQVLVHLKAGNQPTAQHFTDNLRILETSIENLDRHLKNFPSLSSQERIASFVQSHHSYLQLPLCSDMGEKMVRVHPHHHLPTIMEGYDPANQPRPWSDDIADDSLLDIDLDSFLLVNERNNGKAFKTLPITAQNNIGIDNPTFLTDEQEENNYKCVKYINSCPDDAYRVESDIVAGTVSEKSVSLTDHYVKRYEDQLHFQSTRELLEDVRDKIRLLSRANSGELHSQSSDSPVSRTPTAQLPTELESMIKTLKLELETYLDRMNQHSELEIRQLCSGIVKNQNIVKMTKAFERRRSTNSMAESDYGYTGAYEAICDGVPVSIREQIASIRCASDPNFKMKRKSLTEVFPTADCYVDTESRPSAQDTQRRPSFTRRARDDHIITLHVPTTQMQRNLSFQQPILSKLGAKPVPALDAEPTNGNKNNGNGNGNQGGAGAGSGSANGSGAESGESGDKDSILEWHRKKPSIWEMYYGTNRMNQSLLGKRNGVAANSSTQATMSYPSSRPESDFTLDLPRAEQLRIKMEKEKKFRQRCRYITTFLSLVFFLLTVMVVSLVLTRGKRMFGSMI